MNRLTFGQPPADPSDWREMIRSSTRNILEDIRRDGPALDRAEIRASVIRAARKALDPAAYIEMPPAEIDLAAISAEERAAVHAGAFRVALLLNDVDWREATTAESIMAEIHHTLDQALEEGSA